MIIASKCDMCDKSGLPILLVRDAIAPAGMLAPVAPDCQVAIDPASAHYTKRILRTGYVNLFDEARNRWETYFVTVDGYLRRIPNGYTVPSAEASKPFSCDDRSHRSIAGCITVQDPKNATKVWIGFSDVCWTDAVRRSNGEQSFRARHMVCIDVKALLMGSLSGNLQPIGEVDSIVAEYAMSPANGKNAFDWNPFHFFARFDSAGHLKAECEKLRPKKGVIVTLADPAGILQELSVLMKSRMSAFMSKHEDRLNLAASTAIDQIEDAIRTQAEYMEDAAAEHLASEQEMGLGSAPWVSTTTRRKIDELRQVNSAELKRAADIQWKKYTDKFDNMARKAWKDQFDARLKAFDKASIAPLATAHAKWMHAPILAESLQCNFDRDDLLNGIAYTAIVTKCIEDTQDKAACGEVYKKFLNGDVQDHWNILLRATLLNNDRIAQAVGDASQVKIDLRQLSWDNVFAVYTGAVEQVRTGASAVLVKLFTQMSGAVASMFINVMKGSVKFRAAMIATGLMSGHPLVVCDITGTKKEFRTHLVRELMRASGTNITWEKLEKSVAAEIKRQQNHGVQLQGQETRRYVMIADHRVIKNMPSGMTPNQQAKWLAGSLKSVNPLEQLQLSRWRNLITSDVCAGLITGILQFASLTKLIEDAQKSIANERYDATRRMWTGWLALGATTAELFGNMIARGALGLRFGGGMAGIAGKALTVSGKAGGIFAGLIAAGLDVRKVVESRREGQQGMALLYGVSAFVGGALSLAIGFSFLLGAAAIPIIGVLVILAIAIGIWIEHVKDNPIQDWLERCPWGILKLQRYTDLKTLQDQLQQACK